ncbi:MAG: hypothetical protein AAGE92_16685, partial [Cyanobacteria bacterium P01_G01_bin.4]
AARSVDVMSLVSTQRRGPGNQRIIPPVELEDSVDEAEDGSLAERALFDVRVSLASTFSFGGINLK